MLITQQTSVPLSMLIKCSKLSLQSKHHLFIMPSAIEALYTAWTNCTKKEKYAIFEPALDAATCKLEEYYMKTTNSDVHIIMMSSSQSNCMMPPSEQSKKSCKADSLIHDNIEMDSEYECEAFTLNFSHSWSQEGRRRQEWVVNLGSTPISEK